MYQRHCDAEPALPSAGELSGAAGKDIGHSEGVGKRRYFSFFFSLEKP